MGEMGGGAIKAEPHKLGDDPLPYRLTQKARDAGPGEPPESASESAYVAPQFFRGPIHCPTRVAWKEAVPASHRVRAMDQPHQIAPLVQSHCTNGSQMPAVGAAMPGCAGQRRPQVPNGEGPDPHRVQQLEDLVKPRRLPRLCQGRGLVR